MDNNLIYLLLTINVISFLLGYIFGKFQIIQTKDTKINYSNKIIKRENQNGIEIDDKKVVVKIDTKGLEKKYDSLGDVRNTQDNISESVNKLKNLKG